MSDTLFRACLPRCAACSLVAATSSSLGFLLPPNNLPVHATHDAAQVLADDAGKLWLRGNSRFLLDLVEEAHLICVRRRGGEGCDHASVQGTASDAGPWAPAMRIAYE
eukprot:1493182-Prymnesium_polylepis.1